MNTDWKKNAVISSCGKYRYALSREREEGAGEVLFIMLNPSTADASTDDPTIRRCLGFTVAWGFKRLEVRNLFAYRATDPKDLISAYKSGIDVVGPENDLSIEVAASPSRAQQIICAWGTSPLVAARDWEVLSLLGRVRAPYYHAQCLGKTKGGHPRHPLYLSAKSLPIPL